MWFADIWEFYMWKYSFNSSVLRLGILLSFLNSFCFISSQASTKVEVDMEKAESLQVTRGDFLASLENDIKPVSVHECARVGVAHSVMTATMEEGKCPSALCFGTCCSPWLSLHPERSYRSPLSRILMARPSTSPSCKRPYCLTRPPIQLWGFLFLGSS